MHKIAQLISTPGRKSDSVCDIYVAQPDTNKEALVGKLFILAEIKGKKSAGLKLLNFIINNINFNYYQNEKIYLIEKISTLKPEHIFESSLAKANEQFNEFVASEKIRLSEMEINLTAGIIHDNNIYFTNSGGNKALLLYRNEEKGKDAKEGRYKIADITKRTADDKQEASAKLYRSVISGALPQGGYFLIANETLPEYLSSKQLLDIITTLPPAGAAEQLKNLLLEINSLVPFLGLIIKNVSRREAETRPAELSAAARSSTQDSITGLNVTEGQTEKLLTPSGIISLKKFGSALKAPVNLLSGRKAPRPQTLVLKDKSLIQKNINAFFVKKALIKIRNFFIHFFNFLFYLLKNLSSKDGFFKVTGRIGRFFRGFVRRSGLFYKSLGIKSRIFMVIFLVAAVLLVQNMYIVNSKNKEIEQNNKYNEAVQLIEQKENQAEANLLYSNDAGAKKLFDEIESLINGLPGESPEQQEKIAQFQQKLDLQLEKLRKVERVDAEEIADIAKTGADVKISNITLAAGQDKIYAADNDAKSIYIIGLKDKVVTALAEVGAKINTLLYPVAPDDGNIYYLNGDNIISLDTTSDESAYLPINLASGPEAIAACDIYNSRYYALTPSKNQIYRYNRALNSFGTGQPWITEDLDLSDAVSLSIDGNIYVLEKDGQVLKLLSGKPVDFKLETVDPPLNDCTKLSVSREENFLYVLEPSQKRLVVFDKTGQFLTQYTSDQFDNLSDFIVDEANKTIYVLNGDKVYSFKGTHFE